VTPPASLVLDRLILPVVLVLTIPTIWKTMLAFHVLVHARNASARCNASLASQLIIWMEILAPPANRHA